MNDLIEKVYNCYMAFLNRLNYGKVNQNYCMIYDAIMLVANDITDAKYIEYFTSNLNCPILYPITYPTTIGRMITWTINNSSIVTNNFSWYGEIDAPVNKVYPFTTNSVQGFNYLYISVPEDSDVIISNELNIPLYDSRISGDQEFTFVGTLVTSKGGTNNIYKKNDVYNTHNKVMFKVELL